MKKNVIDKEMLRNEMYEMYSQLINGKPLFFKSEDGCLQYYSGKKVLNLGKGSNPSYVKFERWGYGKEKNSHGDSIDFFIVFVKKNRYRQEAYVHAKDFDVSEGFEPAFEYVWSVFGE